MSIFRISAAEFTGETMWGLDCSKKEGAGVFCTGGVTFAAAAPLGVTPPGVAPLGAVELSDIALSL
jgi:hypothetical protein